MEERILIYKDAEYNTLIQQYKWVQNLLQDIADGLKGMNIEPTTNIIKGLLQGEDMQHIIAKSTVSDSFKNLPRTMAKAILEMFTQGNKEEYMAKIGEKVERLKTFKDKGNSCVDFSLFYVEDSNVILSQDYIKQAEEYFCIFVDTPGRKAVYEKWLQFKQAFEEFETAVKEAPKVIASEHQKNYGIYPEYLKALDVPGNFSLAKVGWYDGKLHLNEEYFKYIQ